MSECSSTWSLGNQGCEEDGEASASFTGEITSFKIDPENPHKGIVTLSYTNTLSYKNVKFASTDGPTIDAWQLLGCVSSGCYNIETLHTTLPRVNCEKVSNTISGTMEIPITSRDTEIRMNTRWSTLNGYQWGECAGDCCVYAIDLGDYAMTPPVNLQCTFPTTIMGTSTFGGRVGKWSDNPAITTGHFSFELIDSMGNIINWIDGADSSALYKYIYLPSMAPETVPYNARYTIRIRAINSAGIEVSQTSNELNRPPSAPVVLNKWHERQPDGRYTLFMEWAKASDSAEGGEEKIYYSDGGISTTTPIVIAIAKNGEAVSGVLQIPDIAPIARSATFALWAAGELGKSENTSAGAYSPLPAVPPQITYEWDSQNKCVTLTATPPYYGRNQIRLTNGSGTVLASKVTVSSLKACDLPQNAPIYVQVVPYYGSATSSSSRFGDSVVYDTFVANYPILGIAKNCDEAKNIIDIVEKKPDGTLTPRWQNDRRVVKTDSC